ncbi:hypothetical protein D9758_016764 [Tetrapyrgos nigripes]|uniref:Uncharacterized protein n=1 Tax=Tetrapyrgos nigripes TaxID=182062 RepID=A0A8H5FKH6_9AGAR|nr:hypothetical protein D9758_016764 [Tetrapyrgos nigripes]
MPPRKTSSYPTPSPAPLPAPAPPADGNWDLYTDPLYLSQRPLRLTHLCSHIPPFVSDLFHEETCKWLDAMAPKVGARGGGYLGNYKERRPAGEAGEACDGGADADAKENEKTKAVWARDTLDLDHAAYDRFETPFFAFWFGLIPKPKLQDLDKPWEKLTPLIPGNEFLTEMKTGAGADGDAGGAAVDAAADMTTTLPVDPMLTTASTLAEVEDTTPPTTPTPLSLLLPVLLPVLVLLSPPPPPLTPPKLHPTTYHTRANAPTPTTYYPNANTNAPTPTPYTHSPLTTLLLDDYPLKARLQPYTRFCIPEYSRDVWVMWVLSGAEGGKGGNGVNGDKVVKAMVLLWAWAWVANLQEAQEREREEERGIQATDGPTEIEIPTDEDAVTEDVVANTSTYASTDSIVVPTVPTVPNSPVIVTKLKRQRTLNDMGSTVDIFTTASTASTSTSLILCVCEDDCEIVGDGDQIANSNWGGGAVGGTMDMDISMDGHGLYDGMPPPPPSSTVIVLLIVT